LVQQAGRAPKNRLKKFICLWKGAPTLPKASTNLPGKKPSLKKFKCKERDPPRPLKFQQIKITTRLKHKSPSYN